MLLLQLPGLRQILPRVQWRNGLRAGLAVGVAMAACKLLHYPMGWAALGALYVSLVDNGGPYRTRIASMATVLLPGAFAALLGTFAGGFTGHALSAGLALTAIACFSVTLSRVIAQPIAASSTFILICYVVAYGDASAHTLTASLESMTGYLLGGLWSASLAFLLWPLDPFLPARTSVAQVFALLQQLSAPLLQLNDETDDGHHRFNTLIARTRVTIEAARATLSATPARMTARTVRARNLTVLLESADLIFARILRFSELDHNRHADLVAINAWLQSALSSIEQALENPLQQRPDHLVRPLAPEGSVSLDLHRSEHLAVAALQSDASLPAASRAYLIATLHDTLFNLEVCFEAVRALWTGIESRTAGPLILSTKATQQPRWIETLRANLTLDSIMFRYAVRLAAVVTLDLLFLRLIHVSHSYWMPMTSLIVLRPFAGETVKRSADRVLGTVLGGSLAALLTAVLPSETALLVVVALCAAACVAVFTVDYAWYCFFVTPAIVLLTRPHLHDWHLAALRAGFTALGALIAILAMLLLWPERESLQLPRLLARAAAADAAYLRAVILYWQQTGCPAHDTHLVMSGVPQPNEAATRITTERTLLAPARRRCGLAVNDAEETLDHALLEHAIPLNPRRDHTQRLNSAALTFTTYLRRITRTTTTLAAMGPGDAARTPSIEIFAARLEAVSNTLRHEPSTSPASASADLPVTPLLADALRRLDRQITILESTATELAAL